MNDLGQVKRLLERAMSLSCLRRTQNRNKTGQSRIKEWWSDEIKLAIHFRSRLKNRTMRNPSLAARDRYVKSCRVVKNLIAKAKAPTGPTLPKKLL